LDVNTAGLCQISRQLADFSPRLIPTAAEDCSCPEEGSSTYYIISAKVLRMLEGDNIDLTGGSAYAQSATVLPFPEICLPAFRLELRRAHDSGRPILFKWLRKHHRWRLGLYCGGAANDAKHEQACDWFLHAFGTQNGTLTLMDAAGSSTFNIYMVDPAVNILDPNNSSGGGGALLLHTDALINGTGNCGSSSVSATPSFVATMLSTSRIPSPPLYR